jgi:glutamine synthetase
MNREPHTMFCYGDISGQVRGKGFPTRLLAGRLGKGIGWTPTNIMITAFGPIADTPWGPLGDLILMPDPATEVKIDFGDGSPVEHFFLCDVVNTDLTPWACCPRRFLKTALETLRRETGLTMIASFEHEFVYGGANSRPGDGYALDAIRRHGVFGEAFLHALTAAGVDPETYLPEYAPGQFEVTVTPAEALVAADRAVILREVARATAYRLGHTLSFAPLMAPDTVGNGVHIHMSFRDEAGRAAAYDATAPHGLSGTAGAFVAGILRHLPALTAFTTPSAISFLRLKPHRWSAAFNNLGYRDREAGVRICPIFESPGFSAADQFNFEFRAADATAIPYLQLGALVQAGLQGIRERLPAPEPTDRDPSAMDAAELHRRNIVRLPQSLEEALAALDADATAKGWFPPALLDAYLRYKRTEVGLMADLSPEEQCARYVQAY